MYDTTYKDIYIYGIIQFGPKTGLAPVIHYIRLMHKMVIDKSGGCKYMNFG